MMAVGGGTFAVTKDDVRATYFGASRSVADLYKQASGGALTVAGDVFGVFDIDAPAEDCDLARWTTEARADAAAAGVDLSGYTNFAFLFPRVDSCSWAGLSDPDGNESYINAPAKGDVGLYHAAHELGHNLGAGHANALRCSIGGAPVAIADNACVYEDYADPYTLMGSGVVRRPSAWDRAKMGLIDDAATTTLDASARGSFEIAAPGNAGTQLLIVRRPSAGFLILEYSRSGGSYDPFATWETATGGVIARYVRYLGEVDSGLVDATPATASLRDAALFAGRTFTDSGVEIAVTRTGSDSATIELREPGQNVLPAPSPLAAPTSFSATMNADSSVALSWSASSGADGTTAYRIYRNGNLIGTSSTTRFQDRIFLDRTQRYGVQAVRGDGATSSIIYASVTPPDLAPPSAPGPISVRISSADSVIFKWTSASDDRAVFRYVVRLDGRAFKTRRLSLRISGLMAGTHLVTVRAVDTAGKRGAPSRLSFELT